MLLVTSTLTNSTSQIGSVSASTTTALTIGDWIELAILVLVAIEAVATIAFLRVRLSKPKIVLTPRYANDLRFGSFDGPPGSLILSVGIANEGKLTLREAVARLSLELPREFHMYDRATGMELANSKSPAKFVRHVGLHWSVDGPHYQERVELEPAPIGLETHLSLITIRRIPNGFVLIMDQNSPTETELFPSKMSENMSDVFSRELRFGFSYGDVAAQTSNLIIEVILYIMGRYEGGEITKRLHLRAIFPGFGESFDLKAAKLAIVKDKESK